RVQRDRPAAVTGGVNIAFTAVCKAIDGLPAGFRIHDLRHYFASLLIAAGLDVKTVQARLRHTSAKTTLDVYGTFGRTVTSCRSRLSRQPSRTVRQKMRTQA
ncbi:MAG TPA: tyrosine-type recombinase/integrase, partial [Humibacter sp.]|nr:tyrosine-type recombinase/integrase [Humibacter sp.]